MIQVLPILWYQHQNGPSANVAKRGAFEIEYYSLRFIDLLLPIPHHAVRALADFSVKNRSSYIPGEATAYLGIIGAMGVVVLLVGLIGAGREDWERTGIGVASRMFIFVVVASGLGGFNQVLASVGFTQIRVWSRSSIIIAFLALFAVGIVGERVHSRFKPSVLLSVPICALILFGGVWDTNRIVPSDAYAKNSTSWHNDHDVVAMVADTFGPGARILQLPVLKFPEQGPVEGLGDYSQLRGQLHSSTLCWSYGVVIGRDGGRTTRWQSLSTGTLVSEARRSGFDAVWVERRAYADNGVSVVAELEKTLGGPVLRDRLGFVEVFDLRSDRGQKREDCN